MSIPISKVDMMFVPLKLNCHKTNAFPLLQSFLNLSCESFLVTKKTKKTDSVETHRQYLNQIISFCQHDVLNSQRETPFFQPNESELSTWIDETIALILEKVIPESFWDDPVWPEFRKIVSFDQEPVNISEGLLMLVIYASWDQECCENIVKCLQYGAEFMKSHHLQWMCSFSSCIAVEVKYSAILLPYLSKSQLKGKLFAQAICLRQAVCISSRMYQVFDDFKLLTDTVLLFCDEITPCKLLPVVLEEPSGGYHIRKEGKDSFTIVSIVDWYKKKQIIPKLNQILALKPIKALMREITTAMSQDDITLQKFSEGIENHSTAALRKLEFSVEEGCSARLVAFVMTARELISRNGTTSICEMKEMLLLRFFVKCLGSQEGPRNATSDLKGIVESINLVSMDFVAELMSRKFNMKDHHWCCFLKFNEQMERQEMVTRMTRTVAISRSPLKKKYSEYNVQRKKRKSSQQEKQVSFSSETVDHTRPENTRRKIRRSSSSMMTKNKILAARELHKAL